MKENKKSKGLGDSIEKITKTTGIKKVVEILEEKFDFNCGCEKRKEILNKIFPYRNIKCLEDDEYNYLSKFNWETNQIDPDDAKIMLNIYNRIFSENRKMTTCGSCWKNILNEIKTVFIEYKQ